MAKKHATIKENGFIFFSKKHGLIHVQNSVPRYGVLLQALLNDDFDEEKFLKLLTESICADIEEMSKGEVTFDSSKDTYIFCDGEERLELPRDLYAKMQELVSKGASYDHLRNFWRRCQCNPNPGSVEQLFAFVSRHLLTITDEGLFVAYKAVRDNYYDKHSGTFDNHPGLVVTMPRAEVTFDPNTHCAAGLHVSNYDYAYGFASGTDRIVVCLVDPADVVSVPNDCSAQKIRVCKYIVQSDYTPSLAFKDTGVVDSALGSLSGVATADPNRPWSDDEHLALVKFIFENGDDADDWMFCDVVSLANLLGRTTDGIYARLTSILDTEDIFGDYESYDEYEEEFLREEDEEDYEYDDYDDYEDEDEDEEYIGDCGRDTPCGGECCGQGDCSWDGDEGEVEPWENVVSTVMSEDQLRFLYEQVKAKGTNWQEIQQAMCKKFPFAVKVHVDTLRKTAKRMGL